MGNKKQKLHSELEGNPSISLQVNLKTNRPHQGILWASWYSLPTTVRILILCLLALLAFRLFPKPSLTDGIPLSSMITARGGELLRLSLAQDQQYRIWLKLKDIPQTLQQIVLLYEDKYFYYHPGFNPLALVRSASITALGSRKTGGSTITMQLAKRLFKIKSGTIPGKLLQIVAALYLELAYSKDTILETYLNLLPYGGNIEGIGAASIIYFHHSAQKLNLPQMLNLAVIPQNPTARHFTDSESRKKLLDSALRLTKIYNRSSIAKAGNATIEESVYSLDVFFNSRNDIPFRAPHYTDLLLRNKIKNYISTDGVIASTLDLEKQTLLENAIQNYISARNSLGVYNATALLLDYNTMEVVAMVGSANYGNDSIQGQVNGTLAKRSPGSAIKPFIYGLAIDEGIIHSQSIIKDAKINYGIYSPENNDGNFVGPISATEALIRSRNVPAVYLSSTLKKLGLYNFLQLAEVRGLQEESFYGLALALGGAEVSSLELASLYAILANEGKYRAIRITPRQATKFLPLAQKTIEYDKTLLSPQAAFIVRQMLQTNPRPDLRQAANPPVAWKTGTSWSYRDAWTAGIFGNYVLVVWVGNFDGTSNPEFLGLHIAAPLFFRIVDALRSVTTNSNLLSTNVPENVRKIEVCADSGQLPNEYCPIKTEAWFIEGKSPIEICDLHKPVFIEVASGKVVKQPGPGIRQDVYAFWSSEFRQLFADAGLPLRMPPELATSAIKEKRPRIQLPIADVTYVYQPGKKQLLHLQADGFGKVMHWFADSLYIGQSSPGQILIWEVPLAGNFVIRVVDAKGFADSLQIKYETQ